MGIAPFVTGPERDRSMQYDRDTAVNTRRRGPLRFEEGIATDTDIPVGFRGGAYADTAHARPVTEIKGAAETMRERTHMGSSTWIDAEPLLREFSQGVGFMHSGPPQYEREMGSEQRFRRQNRAVVSD